MQKGSIALVGADVLQRKLQELEKTVARKIASQALRAGAKVILEKAKQQAPRLTGTLARSLKVRAGKRRKDKISFVVQTKDGDYKGDTFYGAFVEFGHKIGKRIRAKGLKHLDDARKSVPANPFLERAFDQGKTQALTTITNTLQAGILAVAA